MKLISFVCLVLMAAARSEDVQKEWWMELPHVEPLSPPEQAANYRPVVLMHGLGDSGSNSGMQSLAKSVETKYPGIYATSLDVADSTASYFTLIGDQVDEFAAAVRKDPKLANGFNAVGFSQGGPIVLGYIARYNDPPVHNFVSVCGPVNGVGECPKSIPSWICSFFKAGPYTAKLSFAGYWKEAADEATYLKESTFLADILNERPQKNATYKANIASLNSYALVKALQDTVVYPHESEQHGFWAWGDSTHSKVVPMNETQGYKEDWIGLKTLDASGRLFLHEFDGDHLRFSNAFWDATILPYFNNTLPTAARLIPTIN